MEPKGPPCMLAALLGFLCLPLATRPSEVGLHSERRGHRTRGMTSKGSTWHGFVSVRKGVPRGSPRVGPHLCPLQGTGSLWISWKS